MITVMRRTDLSCVRKRSDMKYIDGFITFHTSLTICYLTHYFIAKVQRACEWEKFIHFWQRLEGSVLYGLYAQLSSSSFVPRDSRTL